MKRTVIKIDEALCTGCGACVGGCHEGALQLIDGKAVMVGEIFCDGLGACIGDCPVGAITLEEREAEPYDEVAVLERLIPKGKAAITAHLKHLEEHGETEWLRQGVEYLSKNGIQTDFKQAESAKPLSCGCPGSMARRIERPQDGAYGAGLLPQPSELRHFPVQLRLVNPQAGLFNGADLLLAADCTAFASGEFHSRFLRGKMLVIACPKLDSDTQVYEDKLVEMIDGARINTLTILVMAVPCCQGLVRIAQAAAQRNISVKVVVLSVSGEIISDNWI